MKSFGILILLSILVGSCSATQEAHYKQTIRAINRTSGVHSIKVRPHRWSWLINDPQIRFLAKEVKSVKVLFTTDDKPISNILQKRVETLSAILKSVENEPLMQIRTKDAIVDVYELDLSRQLFLVSILADSQFVLIEAKMKDKVLINIINEISQNGI